MIKFQPYPSWFYGVLAAWLPVLFFFFLYGRRKHKRVLQEAGSPELIERLTRSVSPSRRRLKGILRGTSLMLLVVALTGPRFSRETRPVERKGVDLVFLLDVSNSMAAQDIQPSRLDKAKYEIRKLVRQLRGDRVGLVVFAGHAYLECPLTLDYAAFEMFLDIADQQLIGVQGTSLAEAIRVGLQAFQSAGKKNNRVMVLISDGEDHEGELDQALQEARAAGVVIHTAGVGTLSATPIPILNDERQVVGYKKDKRGEVVTTRLNTETLEKIAAASDGRFVHLNATASGLESIYDDILKMDKQTFKKQVFVNYKEQYAWFAWPAWLLLVLDIFIGERNTRARTWEGEDVASA